MKSSPIDRVLVVKAATPGPELPLVDHGGSARAVVWPGVGAKNRSMHLIELDPNGRTVELTHGSECVYHVTEGDGIIEDIDAAESHDVITGSMFLVEPGTRYRFVAGKTGALVLGGPCPPDLDLYPELSDESAAGDV